MKKVSTFKCDYCSKSFKSMTTCKLHEVQCMKIFSEKDKLEGMFLCLVRHFEKKGYNIAIRYNSDEAEDYIISIK